MRPTSATLPIAADQAASQRTALSLQANMASFHEPERAKGTASPSNSMCLSDN